MDFVLINNSLHQKEKFDVDYLYFFLFTALN